MARVVILLEGWPVYAGPMLALLIAAAGRFLLRRRVDWMATLCAGAMAAGWFVVNGAPPVLGGLRSLQQHLVLPAMVVAIASGTAVVLPGVRRWVAVGAAIFAGCWLAGSAAGRPEFWRVVFAVIGGTWLLHGVGAGQARRGLVSALTLFGGVLAFGGAASWGTVALVLVAVTGALLWAGETVIPPALLATAIVAVDLGIGRLFRGGVGVVDLVCGLTLVVPGAIGWADRRAGARFGRATLFVVPVAIAVAGVVAAWAMGRVVLR